MKERTTEQVLDDILKHLFSLSQLDEETRKRKESLGFIPNRFREVNVENISKELKLTESDTIIYIYALAEDKFVSLGFLSNKGKIENYSEVQLTVKGYLFIKDSGYEKLKNEELAKEKLKKNRTIFLDTIAEKQSLAASEQATAAKDSSKFAKYLFWVTLINIAIVAYGTWQDNNKEELVPQITVSDNVQKELKNNQQELNDIKNQLQNLQSQLKALSPPLADTLSK